MKAPSRNDPVAQAAFWALRSKRLRTQRRTHEHGDAEIARVFAGEWGLAVDDHGRLFRLLLGIDAVKDTR